MEKKIYNIIENYNNDKNRLMDILIDVQNELGNIDRNAVCLIADFLKMSEKTVGQTVSFYHFFNSGSKCKYSVYLNNSAVANMNERSKIASMFEKEAGCSFGKTTADGLIGLYGTSCIGMNDQEPAAIINGKVFTNLTEDAVKEIVKEMKNNKSVEDMITEYGDGKNQSDLISSMVNNNIRQKGPVIFSEYNKGDAVKKAVELSPEQVIKKVKISELRGRGGAGFPTGMKWEFCRSAVGSEKYVICNADEGEPGTFKDRVILTELPELLFEGMIVAGYAIGAREGILYLRSEYTYLKKYLESILNDFRKSSLLGESVGGKYGFDFDIRIQMGAGAYVCGEESALIESAEGKRGEPRNRPPFPVQKGYLQQPTAVNNVETLCCAAKILSNGAQWFSSFGSESSYGTKLLSVSGDCEQPGIYEIEWGMKVEKLLELVGAGHAKAVWVGGPSGICISPEDFSKKIDFDDLATGGSIMIIGNKRNLFDLVLNFMEFFIDESCGVCTPCRAGNVVLKNRFLKIVNGNGTAADLKELENWCEMFKSINKCGLGQTAANPILTTIKNFKAEYENLINKDSEYESEFDLEKAVSPYNQATESCCGNTPCC